MLKTKKQKQLLSALMIFVMMAAFYGVVPSVQIANAVDAIADAEDLITDSDVSVVANHTFTFVTSTSTVVGDYIDIALPAAFGTITAVNATCPDAGANWTKTLQNGNRTLRCTATAIDAAGSQTVTINSIDNPNAEGTQYIEITHFNSGAAARERVTVAVAIIQDVLMTARVTSSLTFTVTGTTTAGRVDGVPCSNDSTSTTTPFGTLVVNATSTVCQTLKVTTNADDGYTVTVFEDDEMTSDSGSNINSFNNAIDDAGNTTAAAWAVPTNVLDSYNTYGHMGLHSSDADLDTLGGYVNQNFDNGGGSVYFAGLNASDPLPIMHHDGPSDGITPNKGAANVIYQVQIASLQEAGDYQNTLTYVCTPIF